MEIRTSRPDDIDQVEKLIVSRMDPSDGIDARLLMTDPDAGCEWVAVATDEDRVVSTLTLMDETLTLAGLGIPAGQIEQVATDVEYEGKGLVRQLMGWAHDRSERRDHLVQMVFGTRSARRWRPTSRCSTACRTSPSGMPTSAWVTPRRAGAG